MHDLLDPFAALIGAWQGEGAGEYPTIDSFTYAEEITFADITGKPLLAYESTTKALDDGRTLHVESGFLRAQPEGGVELIVAHGFGVVEISSGSMINGLMRLGSDIMRPSSTAKVVEATTRRYELSHDAGLDVLSYEISMEAAGHPMTHHLRARLERVRTPRPKTQRGPGR